MLWKAFNVFFKVVCILISILLTIYWTYKYSKNEDTSLVGYTHYLESKSDQYPVLSFCFKNPFLKGKLENHGINETLYLEFLKGKYFSLAYMDIDYNDITINLNDYFVAYYVHWVNGTENVFSATDNTFLCDKCRKSRWKRNYFDRRGEYAQRY